MPAPDPIHDALAVLARYIEEKAAEMIVDMADEPDIQAMAVEHCTTLPTLCRAMEMAMVWGVLVDHLRWSEEDKIACREQIAGFRQKDLEWMAKVRRKRRRLN